MDVHSFDRVLEPESMKQDEGELSSQRSAGGPDNTVYIQGIQFWLISIAYVQFHTSEGSINVLIRSP